MPLTEVFYYQDADGNVPVIRWLDELKRRDPKAFERCTAVIERLEEAGYELRRPTADLDRALQRRRRFEADPDSHTYKE